MTRFFSGAVIGISAAVMMAPPVTANAAIWMSLLEYQDTGSGSLGPLPAFGVVTLEDLGSGQDVKVTVHLTNPLSKFINTGGPHDPFLFNTMSDNQVTILPPVGSFVDGGHGSFQATPFGAFTDKIGCCLYSSDVSAPDVYAADVYGYDHYTTNVRADLRYTADVWNRPHTQIIHHAGEIIEPNPIIHHAGDIIDGTNHIIHHAGDPILDAHGNGHSHIVNHAGDEKNGASAGQLGDLTFIVHNDAGITFAGLNFGVDGDGKLITLGSGEHFVSNAGGWWFSADIFDAGTGLTYNVAARDASTNLVATVPEPASWALMILGFGGVGAVVRRSRRLRLLTA